MTHSIVATPVRVKTHWFVKAIGWATLLVFPFVAFIFWHKGKLDVAILSLCMAIIGCPIILWAARSSIEIDTEVIVAKLPWGQYQLRWDEVTLIETDFLAATLVFHGDNKRLVVSTTFGDSDKWRVHEFVGEQVRQKQIPVRLSHFFPLTNKNTRVS
jgi:hypothetical protein